MVFNYFSWLESIKASDFFNFLFSVLQHQFLSLSAKVETMMGEVHLFLVVFPWGKVAKPFIFHQRWAKGRSYNCKKKLLTNTDDWNVGKIEAEKKSISAWCGMGGSSRCSDHRRFSSISELDLHSIFESLQIESFKSENIQVQNTLLRVHSKLNINVYGLSSLPFSVGLKWGELTLVRYFTLRNNTFLSETDFFRNWHFIHWKSKCLAQTSADSSRFTYGY